MVLGLRWLDRRLFAPTPSTQVRLIQVAFALVMGVRLATARYWELADLPSALFAPPWFLSWLSAPPAGWVLGAIQAIGVVAAGVVVASRGRSRAAFAVCWGALVVLGGVQTSGGKILHNDVLLLLAAAPFVVPVRRLEPDADGRELVEGWQRRTAMTVVALGYMFSGLMKLRHSGLEWIFSENLRWVLYAGANREGSVFPALGRAIAGQLWLTVAIAGATIATEVLFPVALVWRRIRPLVAAGAVGLHVAVFLLLGLDYWTWVAAVVILFVPWTRWASGDRVPWVTLPG